MKYLRKYNESLSFKDELLDFCESNLAYLIDDGMKLVFEDDDYGLGVCLSFRAIGGMKWVDIRDYIITFFDRLSKEYPVRENLRGLIDYHIEMETSPEGETGTYNSLFAIEDLTNQENSKEISFLDRQKIKIIQFYIV